MIKSRKPSSTERKAGILTSLVFLNFEANTRGVLLMAKGDECRISNCKNIITYKGKVCGKHKWRWAKYRSYDLPGYRGVPNILEVNKLPKGIVKICEIHGNLKDEDTYKRYYKGKISTYYCKLCILSLNIKNKFKGLKGLDCYNKLLEKQNGLCAICFKQNTTKRNGKIKRFAIDHDHVTNKVRALLCAFCNALIGYAQDNIEILESAVKYLKKHKDKT